MEQQSRTQPAPVVGLALVLAFLLFGWTFRGPRRLFWQRMTYTGLTLGALAVAAQPELRRTRFSLREVTLGIASAGVLYGIFQLGDRMSRKFLPRGAQEIDQIYGWERYRDRREIAARLALVIGPSEELFWRGFIQQRLIRAYGAVPGTALATAAYGGAHLVTGNLTLIGAATVAGAFWGGLALLGAPPGALIVSHAVWDVFIFLIAPTQGRGKASA